MQQTTRKGFWESLVSIIINYPENLLDILHYYPDESPKPLIIWGVNDEITKYEESDEVVKALKGKLITIKDASHAVHYEYPKQVNKEILMFLASLK